MFIVWEMSLGNLQQRIERMKEGARFRGEQDHNAFLVSDSKMRFLEGQWYELIKLYS